MARLGRSYPWRGSGLKQAGVVNPAPLVIFLPTLGSHLQARNRSVQSSLRQPKSTQLLSRHIPVNPIPNLFLPTLIKPQLFAINRATQSSLRRPQSTKLRPPTAINPTPNLFLPTLGTHLISVRASRDAYKFKGKSQYLGIKYSLLGKIFLPTLGTHMQAVQRGRMVANRFHYEAKLFPATVINPTPNLFLPTINTHLVAVDDGLRWRRQFKNASKIRPPSIISAAPNLFLPTLGSHLIAVRAARDGYKFKGKSQYTGINYSLLRLPPFLPTLGTHLQAIPRALNQKQKKPYSTKLFPPSVTAAIPLFIPTLGRYFQAIQKSLYVARLRPTRTKLSKPKVVNPFIPTLPSFYPNYDLPPDTLWYENPTYLQGAVGYDDPNTLFDAAIPFDGAITGNITSVYPQTAQIWKEQDQGGETAWQQNPTYLEGSVLYDDPNTLFDAAIPFDGAVTGNITSVYPQTSVLWANQDAVVGTTLWAQNNEYLIGAVLYDDPNTLFDALVPFDGTDNLSSVYPASDTIWAGSNNV